ncbi:hypothetical protein ABT124_23330 [Streptomyces sp. NPDC001982]|uniref:hypothetical protein n=1 Tax=unclassified Streptomyces TaxID=2593676 RepID=UPI00331AFC83
MVILAIPGRGGRCHGAGQRLERGQSRGQPGKLLGSQRAELLGQQMQALAADVVEEGGAVRGECQEAGALVVWVGTALHQVGLW